MIGVADEIVLSHFEYSRPVDIADKLVTLKQVFWNCLRIKRCLLKCWLQQWANCDRPHPSSLLWSLSVPVISAGDVL